MKRLEPKVKLSYLSILQLLNPAGDTQSQTHLILLKT